MNKTRNIVFSVVVSVGLCVVIGAHAAALLPGMDMSSKSQLEGRNYTTFPELRAGAIAKGQVQADLESYVADHVPARDSILLGTPKRSARSSA